MWPGQTLDTSLSGGPLASVVHKSFPEGIPLLHSLQEPPRTADCCPSTNASANPPVAGLSHPLIPGCGPQLNRYNNYRFSRPHSSQFIITSNPLYSTPGTKKHCEKQKALMRFKNCSAIAKTLVCYQHCSSHKSKSQHHTGFYEEN